MFQYTLTYSQEEKIAFRNLAVKNKNFTNVRKILKDKLGFIWVATQAGVIRTDGNNYINYDKEAVAKYKLAAVDIWDIYEDTRLSCVYILSSSGTIDVINIYSGLVVKSFAVGLFSQDNWFMSLYKLNNEIWVTGYQGVFILDEETGKVSVPGFIKATGNNRFCRKILKQPDGSIWLHVGELGLFHINPVSKQVLLFAENKLLTEDLSTLFVINDMELIDSSSILLATSQGLRRIVYKDRKITAVDKSPSNIKSLNSASVLAIEKTDNALLLSANTLFTYNAESKIAAELIALDATSNQKEKENNINELFFDFTEKILWVGTGTAVKYAKLKKYFIKGYNSASSNVGLQKVFYVHPGKEQTFVSTAKGLLVKDSLDQFFYIDTTDQCNFQFTVFPGIDVVSFSGGLKVLKSGRTCKIQDFFKEFNGYASTVLNSSVKLEDSVWVLGTEDFKGILLWNLKTHQVTRIDKTTPGKRLLSNIVNKVVKIEDKVFVLSDKSISVLDEKLSLLQHLSFRKNNVDDSIATYFDICKQNGAYYITAYGSGVLKVDEKFVLKSVISTGSGLCDNGVYNIFSVADTALYVTTNNGLSIINTVTNSIKNLYTEDGLHSNIFEEAAGEYMHGRIYAGGPDGFSILSPDLRIQNNRPPELAVFRVEVSRHEGNIDTFNLYLKQLTIPNDVIQTVIYFSAINWSNPRRLNFAWRITERSEEWSNIGPQNFIPLIGLEHGTYHLQVKAANEDGVWSKPKELVLKFLPKWYQTWWFTLLVFLTASAIIYAFYRYRIAQIKKQHEIRKNIATDLHDDLGSTLNSVKVFTNLAISGVKQEESLQQIKDNLNEATMGLRDMIWVLDDSLDTVDELVTRLKQYALPVAAASNMQATIKASSEVNSRQLTKEEKRNLFLICKEAINNSIKYSGATQLNVAITASGKKIQVAVADNGKGFNGDEVKKGYGLKNMQYRAGQIKYKVLLNSTPGKGTQVEIKPL